MNARFIIIRGIPTQDRRRCASPNTIMWSRHSRRIVPISLSTYGFCHGDRGAVGLSRMPMARNRCLKTTPYAVEQLIVRMAKENRDWGYDRIAGALANLGYKVCDQTVGNVLQRHALPPAPGRKRTTTWAAFIRMHLALLVGTDFFTAEVLTLRGLVTYYVLFFIHLESRRVDIAGITVHPDERWMQQIARNVTIEGCGALRDCRYLLHDRDTKYTQSFRAIIASGWVEPLMLPACSPNLNAYAERWVRS